MTIEAGNLQVSGVLPVREGDRLSRFIPLLVARERIAPHTADQYSAAEYQAHQ
jgi:hypothetical protein